MDIYLSVNNRAEVLRLPILPPEFTVAKGKNNEVFDTVSQGQLKESSSSSASQSSSSSDKEYSLSDSFGTGENTVSDKFSASANETYKLIVGGNDITAYVGSLSGQNSIDELATKMSFEVAKSDTHYVNTYIPQLGDIVNFCTNIEIFRGIIITVDDGDLYRNKYTVCDFGWYLNKSKETYQFNNMNAKKAVIRLCSDFNISIDTIPEFNTSITQIYIDKCISDILSDILEKCGGGYNFDMTPNGIRIYQYGVLQEVVKIDEKDGDANTYAKNKLSELGKVKESFSIEIIEAVNSYTRAGSMITVDDVNYLIESSDHSIKNGIHYVKLGLRKFG